MSQGLQLPHICFSLKPTRTGKLLVSMLMSDLHDKSLLGMEGLDMQGERKKMDQGWISAFFFNCATRALWLLLSWLNVWCTKTTPMSGTCWSHSPVWQMWGSVWSTLPKQGIQPWTKGSPRVPCSCWGLALRKETKGLVATALAALTNIVGWESSAKLDNLINVSWFFSQAWILRTLPPAFAQFS